MKPRMRPDHPWRRRGSAHPAARLTDEQRRQARARRQAGDLYKVIAYDLGVSESTVYRAARS